MPTPALQLVDRAFDLLVVALVLGGMIHGAWIGLFRSTVSALTAVTVFFAPLALVDPLGRWLASMDVPPRIAPVVAFLLLLAAAAYVIRRLSAGLIPGSAMRLPPVVDLVGGSFVGAVTGTVVAGAMLVAGSILPIPPPLRTDPSGMVFDAGTTMLKAFARCLEADQRARSILLYGEQPAKARRPPPLPGKQGPAAALPAGTCIASEPFVDTNGNGAHDDDEAYLDTDGNKIFSTRLLFHDTNANERRDIGLLERYQLGHWHLVSQVSAGGGDVAAGQDAAAGAAP